MNAVSFSPLLRADSIRTDERERLYIRACQSIRHMTINLHECDELDDPVVYKEFIQRLERWERVKDSLTRLLGLASPMELV